MKTVTKADLLKKLAGIPDTAILNISVNTEDITRVDALKVSSFPVQVKRGKATEFCLDFILH
jgi:hypothetical protein